LPLVAMASMRRLFPLALAVLSVFLALTLWVANGVTFGAIYHVVFETGAPHHVILTMQLEGGANSVRGEILNGAGAARDLGASLYVHVDPARLPFYDLFDVGTISDAISAAGVNVTFGTIEPKALLPHAKSIQMTGYSLPPDPVADGRDGEHAWRVYSRH
jgi:hypothetical protein